jgi:hypothetical protein
VTPAERADYLVSGLPSDTPEQRRGCLALRDILAAAIAAAVAEERGRCARLAESLGDAVEVGPGGDCAQGCQGLAAEIAAAIRKGEAP